MPKTLRQPLAETLSRREVRVAPNIYKTAWGWRVYLWRQGKQKPIRFKREVTLEELLRFRDEFKKESVRLRRRTPDVTPDAVAGTFVADARRYLQLATVKAMPTYIDRERDIERWIVVFGNRPRRTVTARLIDEQLQAWVTAGVAPATVNKRRTALMALFTKLDGRSGANPVRDARVYEEPPAQPRGIPYPLIVRILNAIPLIRGYSHLRSTKTTPVKTRIRLEVMAWTGMRPSQLMRLEPEHVSIADRWFVTPRSLKGRRRPRHPRPQIRKPLTADAVAALEQFARHDCWGPFSTSSVYRIFQRAVGLVEQQLRRQKRDKTFTLPHVRPYDLRHSFGTEMFRRTKNLPLVQELLDHSSPVMTKRYALGAVPDALREAAVAFEAATTGGRRHVDSQPKRPAPPRRTPKAHRTG